MDLQGAVQKVALAQAEERNQSAPKIIKLLNELIATAMQRVYADSKSKETPADRE